MLDSDLQISAQSRADAVVSAILLELLATLRANIAGAVAGKDPGALHELRVCVRLTRALQRQFKDVFPAAELDLFRGEFKSLQQLTSAVRDLDVLISSLEFEASVQPEIADELAFSLRVLRKRRTAERRKLKSGLTGARTTKMLDDWESLLTGLQQLNENDRPDAAKPIRAVAAKRIRKSYKQVLAIGRPIDEDSPPSDLHELRKRAKDLRCLVKYLGDLYSHSTIKPLKSELVTLHDVLGGLQDRLIHAELLTETADELVAAQTRAGALLRIGQLLERMQIDDEIARDEFEDCFRSLAKHKRRKAISQI